MNWSALLFIAWVTVVVIAPALTYLKDLRDWWRRDYGQK